MPVPDFVRALRERIGHDPLWLVGATAIVLRPDPDGVERMLAVRRSDNGEWTPVTGIVDPGEHPATTAVRECLEEARVEVEVERLVLVTVTGEVTHVNGDRAQYCTLVFRCRWIAGEGEVGDEESTDVAWFPVDRLPPFSESHAWRVAVALENAPECALVVGGVRLPVEPPPRHG